MHNRVGCVGTGTPFLFSIMSSPRRLLSRHTNSIENPSGLQRNAQRLPKSRTSDCPWTSVSQRTLWRVKQLAPKPRSRVCHRSWPANCEKASSGLTAQAHIPFPVAVAPRRREAPRAPLDALLQPSPSTHSPMSAFTPPGSLPNKFVLLLTACVGEGSDQPLAAGLPL